MLNIEDLFNENFYLTRYPDVAAAVASGTVTSAFEHFQLVGQREERDPSAFFNSRYYREQNPDVAAASDRLETALVEHFIAAGQLEGRNPTPLFDPNFYRQQNPDVAAALDRDEITGLFVHYLQLGAREGRDPNPLVDSNFYLSQNPDVAVTVGEGITSASEHFIELGQFEGRNPSSFFESNFYLSQNPDIAEVAQRNETAALEHFIEFGQFEGRLPRTLFSEIYVFGDSLSDTGNLFRELAGFFPPSPPYFEGRLSNGPIWAEQLAPKLGLEFDSELNFSIAGATTGTVNITNRLLPILLPLPGLQVQIDEFAAANPSADPNGLYVLWAGSNDYLDEGITDVEIPVNNLLSAANKLAAVGARNLMVLNLPNLAASPRGSDSGTGQSLEQLSNAHNAELATALTTLEQNPNLNVISLDVNSLLNEAIANPQSFGFTNVSDAFLDADGSDPNQFLFWDELHPTQPAHALIADRAAKTITRIPELVSILL